MRTEYLHSFKVSSHDTTDYKGKILIQQWRNLADTTLTDWSRLTSPVVRCINFMYSFMIHWEGSITSVVFFPSNVETHVVMRKHQTNTNWETFYKVTLLKCQDHEKQERLRNYHQLELPHDNLSVMWEPGLDPRKEKGH